MPATMRRLVGMFNLVAGLLSLVTVVIIYGLAEELVAAQEAAAQGSLARELLPVWGPDVFVTLNMSLVMLGAAAGALGSAIQQSIVFANRAGHETLERGYLWWYVLRPVESAGLGMVAVWAVNAGLVSIGDTTTSSAGITVLATTGALAGLFTDRVMEKLRELLGATPPATPATQDATADAEHTQSAA